MARYTQAALLRVTIAAAAALFVAAVGAQPIPSSPCHSAPGAQLPFCNVSLPRDARVQAVVGRLTLAEKASLLGNGAAAVPRLGLSAYQWWNEGLHGVANSPGVRFDENLPNATSFPQVIGTAASFNRSLWTAVGNAIGTEGRVFFNLGNSGGTFWTPNVNIFRDPRWGRGQETPGEDPILTGEYARHFLQAFKGDDVDFIMASACCKHFDAYSLEEVTFPNGTHISRLEFDAVVSGQDLTDTYLPAFHVCSKYATGFMCSYNSVNGVPSCANTAFLTDKLRTEWGYEGYVTGDCGAAKGVFANHHYVDSAAGAVSATIKAGMNIDCGSILQQHAVEAVTNGSFPLAEDDLNATLTTLFDIQMRLGYFDPNVNPYSNFSKLLVSSTAHRDLAYSAAVQSIVLLKNSPSSHRCSRSVRTSSLPLSRDLVQKIALIGPHLNSTRDLLGNYFGVPPFFISPAQGIEMALNGSRASILQAAGCPDIECNSTSGIDYAASIAKEADVVVLFLGIHQAQEAEGHDRTTLLLPGQQSTLARTVSAAAADSTTVIVVLLSGGPVDISDLKANSNIDAILWAGYPGQSGGLAIASIIFGLEAPTGRLPVTWYSENFVRRPFSDMNLRASDSVQGLTYRFTDENVIFPFAFGLGYDNVDLAFVGGPPRNVSRDDVSAQYMLDPFADFLSFAIQASINAGQFNTSETILLFVQPSSRDVANGAPLRTLGGFAKVAVTTASATTLNASICASSLTYGDNDDRNGDESGAVTVLSGNVTVLLGHYTDPLGIYNLTLY